MHTSTPPQKRTSAIPSRFVPRPIVVRKERVVPSIVSHIEAREQKKELTSLLQNFSNDPLVILGRRIMEVRAKTQALLQRACFMRRTNGVSFAETAKKNAVSNAIVRVIYPNDSKPDMTRAAARRDYTSAFKKMQAERRSAYELVCAMAARHPLVVRRQRDSVQFVNRKELAEQRRVLNRERKHLSRHPAKEVSSFPIGCAYVKPELHVENVKVSEEPKGLVRPTSPKQVKRRAVIRTTEKEVFIGPLQPQFEVDNSKSARRAALISALSKTKNGQSLLIAFLAVKLARNPQAIGDVEGVLDSLPEQVSPQMETEPIEGNIPQRMDRSGNVAIQEYGNVDRGIAPFDTAGYVRNSVATESQTFSQMSERWLVLTSGEWKQGMASGFNLVPDLILPKEILRNETVPNTQLLYSHALMRSGYKVKIQLNSNKFQVGQLIAGFTYGNSTTHPIDEYINVAGLIQRNHVLLQAGKSNDAELIIPYHYPDSTMRIHKDELNMGKLSVLVMNPLQVTAGVASSCRFTILVSFDNMELFGSVPRKLIYDGAQPEPQMDTVASLCNVGGRVLTSVGKELNRDNPPLPLQPTALVPQSIPSFAYMQHIPEPINVLRADPTGQTPHYSVPDEMNPSTISRIWGLLKTTSWRVTDVRDTLISRFDVSPSFTCYEGSGKTIDGFKYGVYPPVAVMSSMYGFWRGDLEFKLQVVGSAFHTGRLMLAIAPYYNHGPDLSISQMRSCPSQIIDIGESTEIIFRAPYYNRNPWSSLKGATGMASNVSQLFIRVLNPLIAIDSVSPSIDINVFVRGSDNFELSIPRHPRLAPQWGKALVPPPNQYLKLYNKENKLYSTWERDLKAGGNRFAMSLYIQNITDGWEGFTNAEMGKVYKLNEKTTTGKNLEVYYKLPNGVSPALVRYAVCDPALTTSNARGLVIAKSLEEARALALVFASKSGFEVGRGKYCPIWVEDSDWSTIDGHTATNDVAEGYPIWEEVNSVYLLGENLIEPQMDTSAIAPVVSLDVPAATTQMGLLTFGERSPDLKDITRRWIHYASVKATVCVSGQPRDCPYTAKLPIHPYRALDPHNSASFDNRARHGSISLISSAYLLWRGSMRFRFVVTGLVPDGATLYVQHRFDEECNGETPQVQLGTRVSTVADLLSTHYATYVQALNVNSVATVEVPYYQPQEGLYTVPCRRYNSYSNGKLYLWVHGIKPDNINIEIYYSMGDDARFSVWQGFPRLVDLTEFVPEPQMDDQPTTSAQGMMDTLKSPFKSLKNMEKDSAVIKGDISEATARFTKITDKLNGLIDGVVEITTTKETIKDQVSKGIKKTKEKTIWSILSSIFGCVTDKVFGFITHIIYAIISPCAKTVAWAVVNLYHHCFGFTMKGFHKLVDPLINLYESVKQKWNSRKRPQKAQKPEAQIDDDQSCVGYAGLLFTTIASICGLTALKPKDWGSTFKGLFVVSSSMKQGSFVTQFFKDNIELFKRLTRKLAGLFGFESSNFEMFAGIEDPRLKNWIVQSTAVLANSKRDQVLSDPEWAQKAIELAIVGRGFQMCAIRKERIFTPTLDAYIRDISKQLNEIEKSLINRKTFSPARYEPFCLWLGGDSGTLKSTLAMEVANQLAVEARSRSSVHVISPGQAYFDGYTNQLSILMDDFLTTSMAASPDLYFQFLVMKSPALFNPPYSKTEDKDKHLNFQNLIVTTNQMGVFNSAGIINEEAFNRRKDCGLKFVAKDKNKLATSGYTTEELSRFDHVDVYVEKSPHKTSDDNYTLIPRIEGISYQQIVKDFILKQARSYHEGEGVRYTKRAEAERKLLLNCQEGSSLRDYLESVNKQFADFSNKYSDAERLKREGIYSLSVGARSDLLRHAFDPWVEAVKDAGTVTIEPQNGDNEVLDWTNYFSENKWRTAMLEGNDLEGFDPFEFAAPNVEEGQFVEPCVRDVPYNHRHTCGHRAFDMFNYEYRKSEGILISGQFNHQSDKVYSVPVTRCLIKKGDKLIENPDCLLASQDSAKKFWTALEIQHFMVYPEQKRALSKSITFNTVCSSLIIAFKSFPAEGFAVLYPNCKDTKRTDASVAESKRLSDRIDAIQKDLQTGVDIVDGIAMHKDPPKKTWTQAFWDGFKKVIKVIYKVLSVVFSVLGYLCAILGLIGVAAVGYGYYKHNSDDDQNWVIMSTEDATEEQLDKYLPNRHSPQMTASGDYKTLKSAKTIKQRALQMVAQGCEPIPDHIFSEITRSNDQFKAICSRIESNSFTLVGTDQYGAVYQARCIGIYNKNFIVLKHYVEHFQSLGISDVKAILFNCDGMISYQLDDIKFQWTSEGYGMGTFPKSFPQQFKDIRKYMPSEKFDQNYPRRVVILKTNYDASERVEVSMNKFTRPIVIPGTKTINSWTIPVGFEYNWGGKGNCGSLILAPDMACPLIGIHTAGIGEKKGYAEILLKDTFITEDEPTLHFITPQMEIKDNTYGLDGEYLTIGTLDPQMAVVHPTETKIQPSEIHGVFPVETEPAPLRASDPRLESPIDPFHIGVSKRCQKSKEFNPETVDCAIKDLAQKLIVTAEPKRTPQVLSVKEAVEGFTLQGYEAMTLSTSEGYPWIKMRPKGFSDKSWLFNISSYDDGRKCLDGINPDLAGVIERKQLLREAGLVPATYYTACLKDARIKTSKIHIPGKTRIFEISPVDLTIAQRQYFMDFDVAYQESRLNSEHTIGINPDGPEWTEMTNNLISFSSNILTADYSGYGPQLNHAVLFGTFDISNEWYSYNQEDPDSDSSVKEWLVREVLKLEISQGLHIARNTVFRPTCGLPSGNAETVIRNSLGNSIYIRIAYIELAKENAKHFADFYWFKQFVLLYHNGDDLIMAVKDEIISWFNNATLIEFFSRYGIKMTDSLKSGVVRPFCSIEEATYLKRGFLPHPTRSGQWLAPLEEASITDTANWIWRSVDDRSASLQNSEQACRLAYTRGPDFYNKVCSSIIKAWTKLGVLFCAPSWESLDSHVWEGTEGPKYSF